MEWGAQQSEGLAKVEAWHKSRDKQIFRLFGYAGTGKTTLARHFASLIKGNTVYGAYTGKAAIVMQKSGCAGAATLHSMIYKAVRDSKTGHVDFIWNEDGCMKGAALIIIDECSMVNEEMARDVLRYDVPVLVLGDPAQLPPVQGGGYFTDVQPDHMLTEIHRQAEGNPIVHLATQVREGNRLERGAYGASKVISRKDLDRKEVVQADQVLVGMNRTRHLYNDRMRCLLRHSGSFPNEGERLVCLKNNANKGLYNGGLFEVHKTYDRVIGSINDRVVRLAVRSLDFDGNPAVDVAIPEQFFLGTEAEMHWKEKIKADQFNFGYALTVHKSQGSQWENVMLFNECEAFKENWQRWLYTGITRAAERITIVQ